MPFRQENKKRSQGREEQREIIYDDFDFAEI